MPFGQNAQIQRLSFSVAAAGDNTIIPAVAGKLIYVVGLILGNTVATAQNVIFKDGTGGTALSGAFGLALNGGPLVLPQNVPGGFDWYSTSNPANNFVLNLSAATAVGGTIWFVQQ